MKGYSTEQIRNVALISHGGAGKTSLAEAMLYTSGATNRLGRVDAGNTITDYDPDEIKRQVTISTSVAPLEWKGVKVNLLDTPGFFDFIGEVQGALRVVDSAILVVCAASGVEVGTEKVWSYADNHNLPRLVFINKIDRENANFDAALEQLRKFFGLKVFPLQFPLGQENSFKGVIDLVKMKALVYTDGTGLSMQEEEIPAELLEKAQSLREKLVEAAAESDDELMEKYLEEESLSEEEIRKALRKGTLEGKIVPVLCGSGTMNYGIQPLLDLLTSALPSPADRPPALGSLPNKGDEASRRADKDEPLSVLVFKTLADPYVGRVNYFRVYSGTFKSDSQVFNFNKDKAERIGSLFFMRGKNQIQTDQVIAGDIGAVAKLAVTGTGDTLGDKNNPIIFPPIEFPNPVISFAVEPKSKGDEEKVGAGLARFLEEDPTFRVERNTETKQIIISGMGDTHLDVIVERLAKKFGVEVNLKTPKVPYKETIRGFAKKEGKYKKQSGGRGQYGHVFLDISPLPRGEGFVFEDKIVGGVVPRQYIPAVEKGVVEAMEEGNLAKFQVVDLKVALYDGSYHTVDSSEMAFKIAASMALRAAMDQADPVLLEPIMNVEVTIPDNYMGDIMGDLNSRRGRIQGMVPGQGLQVIKAQVPLAEMFDYAIDLRSMTQGRGFFSMKFSHYEEVPFQEAEKIIAAAKAEKEGN
ncbi:MAG: elongation factor G [Dethiobacter sp.]|jgi:elongation factor G|nr:MAG: elongation factor G [Dethiobacter sp.]